jgi:hypothetical protein
MKSISDILATVIGRAMRADADSEDMTLPKSQRHFHAGRREAYLQMVAMITGSDVKDIRPGVLGSRRA